MLDWYLYIVIIMLCVACEGFFSGSETAIVSVDRVRLKVLAKKGSKKAALIMNTLENPERLFSTILLGTNIMVAFSNTLATFMILEYLGAKYVYVTVLIMSPLLLIFGEIVPKTVYRFHAEKITGEIIFPMKIIAAE